MPILTSSGIVLLFPAQPVPEKMLFPPLHHEPIVCRPI